MKYIKVELLARNIYMKQDQSDFFKQLVTKANGNQFIEKYINKTLRNFIINDETGLFPGKQITQAPDNAPEWLVNAVKEGKEVLDVSFNAAQRAKMEHWIDYLISLDIQKDIKMSVPDLIKQVQDWDESFKNEKIEKNDFKGIEVIHEFSDGYKWVKVFSESSLKREGRLMHNCIGRLYIEPVKEGRCEIYSLRDSKNRPHISVEFNLNSKEIAQIKGFANGAVAPKYVDKMQYFLDRHLVPYTKINKYELFRSDMIILNDKLVQFSTLPSYTSNDDLELDGTLITSLPKVININGTLNISNSKIMSISGEIKANHIVANDSNITSINCKIECDSDVDFSNCKKLVECNLDIEATSLNVSNCKKLKSISGNYNLSDDLDLSNTGITQMTGNYTVGDFCDLSFTKIKTLPDGLDVGTLNLTNSIIISLPEKIRISNILYLMRSKIKTLPDNLKVKVLNIKNTTIKKIPDTIQVSKIKISPDMRIKLKCSEKIQKLLSFVS